LRRAIVLYDGDCGFCRWSLAKLLAWDRRGGLRPVALQSPEADLLLPGMGEEERLASWHLVTDDDRVLSAGAAVEPLMRLLPGGAPLAALARALPGATERAYRLVAGRRGLLGRLVTAGAAERAIARIDERAN
jgi:predicted DCC family thiol-disulfide oxidoreductase YuxK